MQKSTHERIEEIFREVFYDDALVITAQTSARDIEAWTSLAHIHLVVAIEQAFGIKFTLAELNGLQDVGELEALVEQKSAVADL
mgnify:CR=1 FL=1